MSAFEELGIMPEIIQAIEEDEWLLPTAVQQDAIPLILNGQDVLVAAQTGSGKTGAFGLPTLQIVHENLRGKAIASTKPTEKADRHCELNLNDKDMFVLVTDDGNECKSDDPAKWSGIRATTEISGGKYMYEVKIGEGLVRLGWGTAFSKLELGVEDKSYGYGSTGKKSWNKTFEDYGETFTNGDVIGCLLDKSGGVISYRKNGRDLGVAFNLPPDMDKIGLKPQICGKGFHVECVFDNLQHPVEGYTAIQQVDPAHTSVTSVVKGKRVLTCMILEPTRELAEQTYNCMVKFNKYVSNPPVRLALFASGIDETSQYRALEEGCDICVGTLQQTMKYVKNGKLDVSHIKFLVLDEADDLQKKDEGKAIPRLNAQIKRGRTDRVQTLFFSATLHTPEIKTMIEEITTEATWVDLKGKDSVPDTVHHVVFRIDPDYKVPWQGKELAVHAKNPAQKVLTDNVHQKPSMSSADRAHPKMLKNSEHVKEVKPQLVVKIADSFKMNQCLIFCRTNVDCNNLEQYLNGLGGTQSYAGKMETGKENPYSCVVLAGARDVDQRRANLESFKEGDVRFLVCTDVAARGLDISGLPYLIQMTLPDDVENYIHRVGRIGRAERIGLAISLVSTEREKVWYHKCPKKGFPCSATPGNTKLTIPFGPDNKQKPRNDAKFHIDEGGCTIWYDEPELAEAVEKRIEMPLAEMDHEDFSVKGILPSPFGETAGSRKSRLVAEPVSRRAKAAKTQQVIVYGKKAKDVSLAATSKHCKEIAPVIAELCTLEKEIQKLYCSTLRCGSDAGMVSLAAPAATAPVLPTRTGPSLAAEAAAKRFAAMAATAGTENDSVQENDDKKLKTATGWVAGQKKGKRW